MPDQTLRGIGSTIRFVETTATTGGARVVVEIAYDGTQPPPPPHMHPRQQENFTVLAGEIHVRLAGSADRVLIAGDRLAVPPGTPHQMWATGPARQRWETAPALRTERFFETLWGLPNDGHTGSRGRLPITQLALSLRHFHDEFRLLSPPPAIQVPVFVVLAGIGRAQGLRPEYLPRA